MKYLICIGHPAQFHLFKNIVKDLREKGHGLEICITSKDILEDLCIRSGFKYDHLLSRRKSGSVSSLAYNFIKRAWTISRIIRKFKPDLLLGSEVTLPILGKIHSVPSIVFSEDDAKIIPQYAKMAFPYTNVILSPEVCSAGKWEFKKSAYNGYQKLAYLHPSVFKADKKKLNGFPVRFFVLRFSQLDAYHDTARGGIILKIAAKIIKILEPHGQIFISTERELEAQFEKYRIQINPLDIHDVLFYADLFIGDSQSMAVESAILGTPSIRFNDFAGEISVLEELEHNYGLSFGIKTNQAEKLYKKITELVSDSKSIELVKDQHQRLLEEKIKVKDLMVWFIENYPASVNRLKENPEYQYNFR